MSMHDIIMRDMKFQTEARDVYVMARNALVNGLLRDVAKDGCMFEDIRACVDPGGTGYYIRSHDDGTMHFLCKARSATAERISELRYLDLVIIMLDLNISILKHMAGHSSGNSDPAFRIGMWHDMSVYDPVIMSHLPMLNTAITRKEFEYVDLPDEQKSELILSALSDISDHSYSLTEIFTKCFIPCSYRRYRRPGSSSVSMTFSAISRIDGKEILIEKLRPIDSLSSARDFSGKLRHYISMGYMPNINFFCLMEDDRGMLDAEALSYLIDYRMR